MEGTRLCDLPADLVGQEILTRVPITSLRAVRSTCKLWDALTKEWVLGGKAVAPREHQFLGFMIKNSKVCSFRFHLCPGSNKDKEDEEENFLDLSLKQVDLFDQVEISRVLHCDGLLLCVAKDYSRLVMWNLYLGQIKCIRFKTGFHRKGCYALGYDINGNRKILRFFDKYGVAERRFEIYEFSSNSWRFLKFTPDWIIEPHHGSVSLKGNAYFYCAKDFLLCFSFTTERFGPRLPLPFHSVFGAGVAFSSFKEEKLAVLYQDIGESRNIVQIWVTTTIEHNYVSWSQFLRVEIKQFAFTILTCIHYFSGGGSFFIDEEEKIAVVFDFDRYLPEEDNEDKNHTTLLIGEGGYFKSVNLRVAHKHSVLTQLGYLSSYLPSLVQLNQSHKGEERGV